MAEQDYVPPEVRAEVIERDGQCCRVCGRFVEVPGLHHIDYRSQGGLHLPSNLIVIGWLPGHDCHLPVVHANKRLWQPVLRRLVEPGRELDGVTAHQLLRWYRSRATRELQARRDLRANDRLERMA